MIMAKEKMTLEKLASMTKDYFDQLDTKIVSIKEEVTEFKGEMNTRLDRIENLLITDHRKELNG